MTLLVMNVSNTLNYGSMMMGENLLYYIGKRVRNVRFILVSSHHEQTISRMNRALRCMGYIDVIRPQDIMKGTILWKLLALSTGRLGRKVINTSLAEVGTVVVLGGDDFTENYSIRAPMVTLAKLVLFKKRGDSVVMCSQSIGPFSSWRKVIVRRTLARMDAIACRDPICYDYLERVFRLGNLALTADLAFLPLAREDDASMDVLSASIGQYFTVVPSEILWRYAYRPVRHEYIRFLSSVVGYLSRQLPQCSIVLLPHVITGDGSDDRLAGRDLRSYLIRQGVSKNRIIFLEEPILPFQARRIIGKGLLTLTGRMHAAVSSAVRLVPFLCFSYSRKYWGVIGHSMGMRDLVMDIRPCKNWELMAAEAQLRLNGILQRRGKLVRELSGVIPELQKSALENIDMCLEHML